MSLSKSFTFHASAAVAENHFQVLLRAELDGAANVARFVGDHQHRQLPFHHRHERLQFQIALEIRRRAFLPRLRVVSRAVEPIADLVDLLVVFLLYVRVRLFLNAKRGEIERARLERRPVDHHRNRTIDLHFVHRPSGQIERRSLSRDQSAALRIESGRSRRGDHMRDSAGARHGMCALAGFTAVAATTSGL